MDIAFLKLELKTNKLLRIESLSKKKQENNNYRYLFFRRIFVRDDLENNSPTMTRSRKRTLTSANKVGSSCIPWRRGFRDIIFAFQ